MEAIKTRLKRLRHLERSALRTASESKWLEYRLRAQGRADGIRRGIEALEWINRQLEGVKT